MSNTKMRLLRALSVPAIIFLPYFAGQFVCSPGVPKIIVWIGGVFVVSVSAGVLALVVAVLHDFFEWIWYGSKKRY